MKSAREDFFGNCRIASVICGMWHERPALEASCFATNRYSNSQRAAQVRMSNRPLGLQARPELANEHELDPFRGSPDDSIGMTNVLFVYLVSTTLYLRLT